MSHNKDYFEGIKYPRTAFRFRRKVSADINKLLAHLRKHSKKGLHLGAGSDKLPGLTNCDLYNPDADLRTDAADLSMFEDDSIDLIESHHMIEHLSFRDTERALTEWYRVLRSGGLIVLTFPDISGIFLKWIKYSIVYPLFPQPQKLEYVAKMLVGSQENGGMFHKNVFDIRLMSLILTRHKFCIEFTYYRYPMRPTPSRIVIAKKTN